MDMEESWVVKDTVFLAYVCPISNVVAFKYLGHIFTSMDNNCPEVLANLLKSNKKWARMSSILRWD